MKAKQYKATAAEWLAQLRGDPEWVRQNNEREAQHAEIVAQLQADLKPEETPLLAELAKAGYAVSSVWDLVNARTDYPNAIPVLVRYLGVARHPVLRQGIARALTVPEARGIAGRKLLEELLAEKDPRGSEERWALANALTVTADKSMISEIEALVGNPLYEDVHERLSTVLKSLRVQ
jgi:hypothetical protein